MADRHPVHAATCSMKALHVLAWTNAALAVVVGTSLFCCCVALCVVFSCSCLPSPSVSVRCVRSFVLECSMAWQQALSQGGS